MGFRFRKSVKIGPARINLSKSGIGYSVGTKGFRATKKAGGGTRTTASIPGTGISFVSDSKKGGTRGTANSSHSSTNLSFGMDSAQKPPRGCLVSGLIWFGVWFASTAVFAYIGMTISKTRSPGALYSLATLIVPCVVATKVAFQPKRSSPQIEPVSVPAADLEPVAVTTPEPDYQPEVAQSAVKAPSNGYVVRTYHVAGTSFRESAILSLSTENPDYEMSKRDLIDSGMTDEKIWEYEFDPSDVKLVPEPDNPHDPNAVKVVVDGEHIGYIKKGSCKHILNLIAKDLILHIDCEMGGGKYKIVVEDYDDEKDKEIYTLERDSTNFFAVLTIREKIV